MSDKNTKTITLRTDMGRFVDHMGKRILVFPSTNMSDEEIARLKYKPIVTEEVDPSKCRIGIAYVETDTEIRKTWKYRDPTIK